MFWTWSPVGGTTETLFREVSSINTDKALKPSVCNRGCRWQRLVHSRRIQSILLRLFKNSLNSNTAESGSRKLMFGLIVLSLLFWDIDTEEGGSIMICEEFKNDYFCISFLCKILFKMPVLCEGRMPDSYNLPVSQRRMSSGQEKYLARWQAYSVTWLLCCPVCDLILSIRLLPGSLCFEYRGNTVILLLDYNIII